MCVCVCVCVRARASGGKEEIPSHKMVASQMQFQSASEALSASSTLPGTHQHGCSYAPCVCRSKKCLMGLRADRRIVTTKFGAKTPNESVVWTTPETTQLIHSLLRPSHILLHPGAHPECTDVALSNRRMHALQQFEANHLSLSHFRYFRFIFFFFPLKLRQAWLLSTLSSSTQKFSEPRNKVGKQGL